MSDFKIDKKAQTFSYGYTPSKYYTAKEIEAFKPIFEQAREMWYKLIVEYGKDEGSCVLGDDIATYILRPRCKYPRQYHIASGRCQGNITKEVTAKPVIEFLKSNGIECWQLSGRMD